MKKLMLFFVLLFLLVLSACENPLFVEASGLYTVSFETNGGTEIESFRTDKISSSPKTQKEGEDFAGWYTSSRFLEEVCFPYKLSENITLYAKWEKHLESYSVDFDSNGGTEVDTFYGSIIQEAPVSTKKGCTFAGWYLDEDFRTPVFFPYNPKKNCTLYARWNERSDVTYYVRHYKQETELNTYKYYTTDELTGTYGALTQAKPKNFDGFHNIDFEQKIINDEESTVIDIYYARDTITVIFDANDGSGKTDSQTFYFGVSQKLKANHFTRQNYIFDGWIEKQTNGTIQHSDQSYMSLCYAHGTVITMYAKWICGNSVTSDTISTLNLSSLKDVCIIKVTGSISQKDLVSLTTKISAANKNITLDLSGTTGLEAIACTTDSTSVFAKCTKLTNVILPSTLTTIGKYAFANCSSLTSITIPSSVKTIGSHAFYSCTGFISLKLDAQNIEEEAFGYCKSLTSVTFTSNVKKISSYAFHYCTSLSSATFLDTKNWYRDNYLMDVTNPGSNASNLYYSSSVWMKK